MNPAEELRGVGCSPTWRTKTSVGSPNEHGSDVALEPGEVLLHEGDPADVLIALLDGEVRMRREKGTPDGRVIVRTAGMVTGMLPFSRLTHSPVTARATIRTRAACFPADLFPEMLRRIPVLQPRLAAAMVDRSREFTRHDEQRERLISLGKLSAGLAHELNNPAAAIQRRVDELAQRLHGLSAMARTGLERDATPAQLGPLRGLDESTAGAAPPVPGALERSDAEERVTAWLEEHELAGAVAGRRDLRLRRDLSPGPGGDLEATLGLPAGVLRPALRWLEADLASRRLVEAIAEASRRIVELIAAVKSYSNMDRGPSKRETDVHEGIQSTLAMLAHKLRSKNIVVQTEFDPALPRVNANPGELNQVWTNLIDNAIDAVPAAGELVIRTSGSDDAAVVQVIDNGAGIPPALLGRVFEPFFTTKDVGEGTGLGLDIVAPHRPRPRGRGARPVGARAHLFRDPAARVSGRRGRPLSARRPRSAADGGPRLRTPSRRRHRGRGGGALAPLIPDAPQRGPARHPRGASHGPHGLIHCWRGRGGCSSVG